MPPETTAPVPADALQTVHNRTFDQIALGDTESIRRQLTAEDIQLFAILSGDVNPQHLDADYAAASRFHGVIAHGMLGGALISAVLGTRLPGPGTIYLGQTLSFRAPVRIGDTLTISVRVMERMEVGKRLKMACSCINQDGVTVIDGVADVIAPAERISMPRTTLPEVRLLTGDNGLLRLLEHVRPLGAVTTAVVHPCDALSLSAALDAQAAGLIMPVLVAPRAKLQALADSNHLDISALHIEDVPHSHAAAVRAASLAASGEVAALMKGSLH